MKMKILITALALCAACCVSACQTQEEIDQRFTPDVVNVTKKSNLEGIYYYMPDSYLENGTETADDDAYDLVGEEYTIKIRPLPASTDVKDHTKLGKNMSTLFGMAVTVTKALDDNTWECYTEMESDSSQDQSKTLQKVEGYLGVTYGYAIIAVGSDAKTLKTIVQSLKKNETYIANAKTIETATLDAELSATVNGVTVGEPISIDAIQSDFAAMGLHYEQMKQDLNNINGSTIQQLQNNVYMQFNAVQAQGQGIAQAYIGSVAEYNSAVNDYNIQLSNGVNMSSKKAEIEKAFGLSLQPEWERLVIENQSNISAIESIIIEYDNDNDKVKSIIINKSSEMDNKLEERNSSSYQPDASSEIDMQTDSDTQTDGDDTSLSNETNGTQLFASGTETESVEAGSDSVSNVIDTESQTDSLSESAIDYDVGIGGVK